MVTRILRWLFAPVLVLLILAVIKGPEPLQAQTTFGTILGTVTDPSEAAVPDTAVTVTNAQTGISRKVTTDQYGNYRVPSLLPGIYNIKAERQGFQVTEVTGVVLRVTETATVNVVLQIGAVTQAVEVTAAAPLLDTATATVGTVVSNTSVVTLPLNGRSFTDLILLTPGSVPRGKLFAISGGHNFAVSGNNPDQNNFTLDGIQNNDMFFKAFASQPSIDAIQEFRVQTNITSAEYGLGAGANVSVAIKPGTNDLHGSVFEFLRNDKLDAVDWFRNYFSTPTSPAVRPAFKHNQWGFVAGGPVYIPKVYNGRDKFFWLVNYEGFKIRRASTAVGTVPTRTQWSGDLRDVQPLYDPATTRVDPATGNLIRDRLQCNGVLNVICPERIHAATEALRDIFYPMTDATGAGNIVNTTPYRLDQYQVNIRADYKIKDNLMFFARYSPSVAQETVPQSLPSLTTNTVQRFPTAVASWTYVPTPTMVIDFKAGVTRTNVFQSPSEPPPGANAFQAAHPLQGIYVHTASNPLYPGLSLEGFAGAGQSGTISPTNDVQLLSNISKIKGRHAFKTGFTIDNIRGLHDNLNENSFSFTRFATGDPQSAANTGSSIASFLLGLPDGGARRLGQTAFYDRWGMYQFYVQDDIKLTRRLSVNLGLRYEWDQLPRAPRGNVLSHFDREAGVFAWAGTNPITGEPANTRPTLRDPDFNNFAPRFGVAYQVNPKTTVRAGYGIFYASNWLWEIQGARAQWPFALADNISGRNRGATLTPIDAFFPPSLEVTPGVPPSAVFVVARTDRSSYTQQWNLGVQRELARDLLLEINYIGTKGNKMPSFNILNLPPPGPGAIGSPEHPRPFPQSNNVHITAENRCISIYHGLQTKLEKRFSSGLQFLLSYAWSHYIDIGGAGNSTESFPQGAEYNFKADRASGIFDFRHLFTASYYYQLPFGRGKRYLSGVNSIANHLIGGWEIAGITRFTSGAPVSVNLSFDNANTSDWVERPDRILGQPARVINPNDRSRGWLNPAAFAVPTRYTYGNLGRATERGPMFGNWDVSLFKNFPLHGEKQVLQFRTEFFNLFNNVSLGNPSGGFCQPIEVCNPNFGRIFGTQTIARQIQFALKFLF